MKCGRPCGGGASPDGASGAGASSRQDLRRGFSSGDDRGGGGAVSRPTWLGGDRMDSGRVRLIFFATS